MRCRSCGHENRAERHFCGECGAPLSASCVACGTANEPGEKFCGGCGAPLEVPASGKIPVSASAATTSSAGERRQLTVLFCDLVGSTALSQRLDAEDWRDVVGQYQNAARAAVDHEHLRHRARLSYPDEPPPAESGPDFD